MAATTAMQTILASPLVLVDRGSKVGNFCTAKNLPGRGRNPSMVVRSMGKDDKKVQSTEPVTTPPEQQPTPAPKVDTKFSDVFAFSGPAPERINGRLAMVGFVSAMAVELYKGEDVFSQISEGGVAWFVGTSILLTVASLIPLFKGLSAESKSEGLMTSDAELWNGRFAMLGLVALAFTEYVKGGALV